MKLLSSNMNITGWILVFAVFAFVLWDIYAASRWGVIQGCAESGLRLPCRRFRGRSALRTPFLAVRKTQLMAMTLEDLAAAIGKLSVEDQKQTAMVYPPSECPAEIPVIVTELLVKSVMLEGRQVNAATILTGKQPYLMLKHRGNADEV